MVCGLVGGGGISSIFKYWGVGGGGAVCMGRGWGWFGVLVGVFGCIYVCWCMLLGVCVHEFMFCLPLFVFVSDLGM